MLKKWLTLRFTSLKIKRKNGKSRFLYYSITVDSASIHWPYFERVDFRTMILILFSLLARVDFSFVGGV